MIENLFPTPIYSTIINNFDIVQKEVADSVKCEEYSYTEDWGKTHFISHKPNKPSDYINDHNLVFLKNEIMFHMGKYLEYINSDLKRVPEITKSWVSFFNPGDYSHVHCHGHYEFGGVYYHKTNGLDGDIFFDCPTPQITATKQLMHLGGRWNHKPHPGKLLLFPGWLKHGVETNTTNNNRISISFNIELNP